MSRALSQEGGSLLGLGALGGGLEQRGGLEQLPPSHDERDEPTLPGPTLSSEGAFEYRARDPSGNRVRILALLPEPGAP